MNNSILLLLPILLDTMPGSFGEDSAKTYSDCVFATSLNRGLVCADYWSKDLKILFAEMGFADIVAVPTAMLTEKIIQQTGGRCSTDMYEYITCTTAFSVTSIQQQI